MKKILTALIITFFLVGCSDDLNETDFEKLPAEKQTAIKKEIQQTIDKNMEGLEKTADNIIKQTEEAFDEIEDKYDDVDFDSYEDELIGKMKEEL